MDVYVNIDICIQIDRLVVVFGGQAEAVLAATTTTTVTAAIAIAIAIDIGRVIW